MEQISITTLDDDIRELVKQNQIAQGNNGHFRGSLATSQEQGNFDWGDSKEGFGYWYTLFKPMHEAFRKSVLSPDEPDNPLMTSVNMPNVPDVWNIPEEE